MQTINTIKGLINPSGPNDIFIDLEDLKTVLRGTTFIEVAEARRENSACKAMNSAVNALMLNNMPISTATGILVNFKIHPEFSIEQINDAMRIIEESVDEEADIIFGTITDKSLATDYVRVTLIASFRSKENYLPANNIR